MNGEDGLDLSVLREDEQAVLMKRYSKSLASSL